MKVVHICLAGSYNDGWSYQDNLLSQYHRELGCEVTIITTPFVNDKDSENYLFFKVGEYINEFGIKIIRLPLKVSNKSKILMKLRSYKGTYSHIMREKPDIIFVHGGQFWDIRKVIKYKKKHHDVKVYMDNHADFSNSARTWFSYKIIHKLLWKSGIKKSIPYIEKYYGVLPSRVDFLKKMYNIPEEKIELLVMGADDNLVRTARTDEHRAFNRNKYGVSSNDFLIISGGKIDSAKWQIVNLLEYVKQNDNPRVKLILFGPIVDDMKDKVLGYVDNKKIKYCSWLDNKESYGLISTANLAVFPGRHSVYWEQVVGCGIPIVVKYWEGVTHIDLKGNCIFLLTDEYVELKEKLDKLIVDQTEYEKMRKVAVEKGISEFSYLRIAQKSIELDN